MRATQIHSKLEPGSAPAMERENKLLQARIDALEMLVVSDTLTPVYNRRHFVAELDRWCWRTHRYGGNYALLFIDVDDLKSVNDTYGHGTGDAMLIGIAKALLDNVRKSDLVARIGGDEFVILLPSVNAVQDALAVADKVCAALNEAFDLTGVGEVEI